MNHETKLLGLDLGSVAIKAVVMDALGRVQSPQTRRATGDPICALLQTLDALAPAIADGPIRVGVTGQACPLRRVCQSSLRLAKWLHSGGWVPTTYSFLR